MRLEYITLVKIKVLFLGKEEHCRVTCCRSSELSFWSIYTVLRSVKAQRLNFLINTFELFLKQFSFEDSMVLTLKTSLYKVAGVDLPFFFLKCNMHSGLHFNWDYWLFAMLIIFVSLLVFSSCSITIQYHCNLMKGLVSLFLYY